MCYADKLWHSVTCLSQISSGNLLVWFLQISLGILLLYSIYIASALVTKYCKCHVITVVTTLFALAWIGQQTIKVSLLHIAFHCSYLDETRLSSVVRGAKFLPEDVIWGWRPPILLDPLTNNYCINKCRKVVSIVKSIYMLLIHVVITSVFSRIHWTLVQYTECILLYP